MILSHEACLELLANPSTQNILEKLGFEYSVSGISEFRKARPYIVPPLVRAIVSELEHDPIFPPSARKGLAKSGEYIQRRSDGYAFLVIDKPSVIDEFVHDTAEGAARNYVYRLLDAYWLEPDKTATALEIGRALGKQPRKAGG